MSKLLDILFGCWHKNYSFPQASPNGPTGHYVVCLDCGKEFDYDWSGMKVVGERRQIAKWNGYPEWLDDAENTLERHETKQKAAAFDEGFLKAMRVKY